MSQRYGIVEVSDRQMQMLSRGHIDILFNGDNVVNVIRDEKNGMTHLLLEREEFPIVDVTYGGAVGHETIYLLKIPHYAWDPTPDGIRFTKKHEVTNG
jgi:hypothetical protein